MTSDENATPVGSAGEALERMVEQALASRQETPSGEGSAEGAKEEIVRQVLLSESYRGSFAHPQILKQMDEIIPNGAERAFSMTEREQAHRHDCDKMLITSEVECNKREYQDRRAVIIIAFIFLFAALTMGFIAILKGHNAGAGLVGGTVLVAMLGIFGVRHRANKADK